MTLRINDIAPDFTAETTEGKIDFYNWMEKDWCVLFSHPKDFTPVCTTELGYLASLKPAFDARDCKIIGLSVDSVDEHNAWKNDIRLTQGNALNFPLIADTDLAVAKLYGMLPAGENGQSSGRTAMDNATVRTVFIIDPDKRIKLSLAYPMSTGRNFDEILRVVDSLQLTAKNKVATPANWTRGDRVIILPSLSDEQAAEIFTGGWHAETRYLRYVEQPA